MPKFKMPNIEAIAGYAFGAYLVFLASVIAWGVLTGKPLVRTEVTTTKEFYCVEKTDAK